MNIFAEVIDAPDATKPGTVEKVTTIYYMLRRMALGKAPADHAQLLDRGYGPVAQIIRNQSELDQFYVNNTELFTDGQLDRVGNGESTQVVIAELLKEFLASKKKK
jgi:hypothetical protein